MPGASSRKGALVDFAVLGPLTVDGAQVSGARRVGLVLRLLIDANHVVDVPTLVEDVWCGAAPRNASTTLQSHVSKLRSLIGRHRVEYHAGGYVLRLDAGELDVAKFEADVGAARAALNAGDISRSVELVDGALARWRGPAYCDVADREWAMLEAARLEEIRQASIELSLEARLAAGELDEVIERAEVAVSEQPLRELRWAHLMSALARSGRQADALRAFARLRAVLVDELGLDPSPALCALETAILQQRPDVGVAHPTHVHANATGPEPPIFGARAAFEARDFAAARDRYVGLPEADRLDLRDRERLADSAWYAGDPERSVETRRQLFADCMREGDQLGAARAAIWLVVNFVTRVRMAVAAGWYHTARRLLTNLEPSVEHGYFEMVTAMFQLAAGDISGALSAARSASSAGREYDELDLETIGLMLEGVVLVRQGDVDDGVRLVDEAMALASSGSLGPFATGLVYCRSLCACLEVGDYRRASEWLEVAGPWVEGGPIDGFPGDCRAHRADLMRVRGSWTEAEVEARHACHEAVAFDLYHVGLAYRELGLLELRRGNFEAADEAFRRTRVNGASSEPGSSLLLLARGDLESATEAIEVALQDEAAEALHRARMLPAGVEIAAAAGDLDLAHEHVEELADLADRFGSDAMKAAVASGHATIAVARDDAKDAIYHARTACVLWREAGAPYELGCAYLLLASALRASGELAAARFEAEQAVNIFDSLGAEPDLAKAHALASGESSRRDGSSPCSAP